MRLARETSRPASIAAHQVAPRVAVTAVHGCQHLPTDTTTAPFLYNPEKVQILLIKLRARVRTNKETTKVFYC